MLAERRGRVTHIETGIFIPAFSYRDESGGGFATGSNCEFRPVVLIQDNRWSSPLYRNTAEVTVVNTQRLNVARTRAPTPTLYSTPRTPTTTPSQPTLCNHLHLQHLTLTSNVSLVPLDAPLTFSDDTDRAID